MSNRPRPKKLYDDELTQTDIDTIDKMTDITHLLLNGNINDKAFNNNHCTYLLDYIDIINKLEGKDGIYKREYSDEAIQTSINTLYNKIFKNRRY